jgi:hypothetical protein
MFTATSAVFVLTVIILTKNQAGNFTKMTESQIKVLELNIANEIDHETLALLQLKNKVEKYFFSKKDKEKDIIKKLRPRISNNIGEVLLLDKDHNIISTLFKEKQNFLQKSLKHRNYLKQLQNDPENIQMDEPVIGTLTHTWAIPLATSIMDTQNKYLGALIFSIKLQNFTEFLKKRNYTDYIKDIVFLSNAASYKVIPYDKTNSNPLQFFVSNIILCSDKELGISYSSSTFDKKMVLVYDIERLRYKICKQIWLSFFLITAVSVVLRLFAFFVIKKIVMPIKQVLIKVEDFISLNNAKNGSLVKSKSNNYDKIERLINTFEMLLANVQRTDKIIANLNNNVSISHNFFLNIIQNMKEHTKYATEILEDQLLEYDLYSTYTELSDKVKQSNQLIEGLHEFSIKSSEEIKRGKEETNINHLLKEIFINYDVTIDGEKEDIIVDIYKFSFIEMLRHILKITMISNASQLYIHIIKGEKFCQLDFSPIIIESNPSSTYFNELSKLMLRALINNVIISFNRDQAQVSILIML